MRVSWNVVVEIAELLKSVRNEIREWKGVITEYAELCGPVVHEITIEDDARRCPSGLMVWTRLSGSSWYGASSRLVADVELENRRGYSMRNWMLAFEASTGTCAVSRGRRAK